MKKFLLLPTLLLAACAPAAAPKGPFAAGDVFTLTGTTKNKEAVSQTITLRDSGERDRGGDWDYDADGAAPHSAQFTINGEQDFVAVVDVAEVLGGSSDARVIGCLAIPSGPGWRSAEGFLLKETVAGLEALKERLESQPKGAAFRTLVEGAGDCKITRQ
ncbi:hypothetical protein E5F05_20235 [Deinococcus metallilatus]|uniref:Lipoprotein n=1 Tax=Deinococcus metallilatus TaxID=1211322 RepID=A0AAJ5F0L2_9DEIO|nr:hypothetical protein [Deinococcus metallilatus]MBB5297148.1 hypothetical protein [Deinococcus metallilatus]QBY10066.1 hypothetical protein E5F05_20235 [Deinococcus metallilatus]RXJ08321.1 hypothetical protein ERJ73_19075 [Deinococcus metallilatus]TLK21969.1 hypothetical protein FCS05_18410 [Deinococcus metallilatus]GMA17287.1 hypothetical protein GCM10025871_36180 [Deinococcus metallilatus]